MTDAFTKDDTMQVLIMRKETLLLQAESCQIRNILLSEFKECIAFAGSCEWFDITLCSTRKILLPYALQYHPHLKKFRLLYRRSLECNDRRLHPFHHQIANQVLMRLLSQRVSALLAIPWIRPVKGHPPTHRPCVNRMINLLFHLDALTPKIRLVYLNR